MLKYYFQKYMRLYSFRSYKNYYGYSIEAPAHSKKTIEISYDDGPNLIHVKGDVKIPDYNNRFYKVIQIPEKYKKEDVKINIKNGLIKLIIPTSK